MSGPEVVVGQLEKRAARFRVTVERLERELLAAREQLAITSRAIIAMSEYAHKHDGMLGDRTGRPHDILHKMP